MNVAENHRRDFVGRKSRDAAQSRVSTARSLIANTLFCATIALAGTGVAATATGDPATFNNLSCSCESPPGLGPANSDQIARGLRDGLSLPQGAQRRSGS
ncbi:hypothetical protein [Mycobacterium sp. ACS4054]|uniref:hypothetical protein n=1 Tax=Mycobacterium sp. ACS4054 TaxID=1834119 RepID=UPI000AE68E10|nr:hypothetical protein [Mycobacterium sp. ACS4054]